MASLFHLPLLLAALALAGCATRPPGSAVPPPAGGWLTCEEVVYQENHDPWMIWLADGREFQVDYGGGGALRRPSVEQVRTWRAGRPLRLAFAPGCGAVLFDPQTAGRLPVIGGLDGRHPLDQLLERQLESADTTVAITFACADNARHWETEVERLYVALQERAPVPPETRDALARARLAWRRFNQAQFSAAAKLFGLASGTKWGNEYADHRRKSVRAQALSLLSLIEPVAVREEEDSPVPELD